MIRSPGHLVNVASFLKSRTVDRQTRSESSFADLQAAHRQITNDESEEGKPQPLPPPFARFEGPPGFYTPIISRTDLSSDIGFPRKFAAMFRDGMFLDNDDP
jgi:hypothetical protein